MGVVFRDSVALKKSGGRRGSRPSPDKKGQFLPVWEGRVPPRPRRMDFFSATEILVFNLSQLFKNTLNQQPELTVLFQTFPD